MVDDEIRARVNRYLINQTDFIKVKDSMTEDQLRSFVNNAIDDMCQKDDIEILPQEKGDIIRSMISAVASQGPIRALMEDPTVTEIMINGAKSIYVQRHGRIELTDIRFDDNRHLLHTVQKILASSGSNKRVDESSPFVDFSMPDGSRVNVIIPPCSLIGPVMTIRKFKDDIGTVEDLLELGMVDKKICTLLIAAMKAKLNVVYCGSTGAGKTTIMNVFSRHIPSHERIITIEDTPELNLLQEHVVKLASKPPNIEGKGEITMRELFINSLRMRPDRIIIGEIRGVEMLDLVQSISSGHSGSLAIVHAESAEDCFNRMVTMMLMTGIPLSTQEIRKQVARAVDLIVHVELFLDGKRRTTTVTDVWYDDDKDKIYMKNIIEFKQTGVKEDGTVIGDWAIEKTPPSIMEKFAKRMVKLPEGFFNA